MVVVADDDDGADDDAVDGDDDGCGDDVDGVLDVVDVDDEDDPQFPSHSRNLLLPRCNYFFARFRLMVSASCFDGYRRGIPVPTKFRCIPTKQAMAVRWPLSKFRTCIQSQL